MDFDSLGERLKKLKQKRVAVTLKNRKEITRDAATPSAGKPKTYSMNEDEGAVRVGEESDSSKSASSNVLHYNILECEKWNQKEKLRSEVLDTAHSADLAHLTYKKEVQRLQKKGLPKGRVTKGEITASGKVKVKDDGQLVERLADTLKETAQQRYVHRRNELSKDGNDGSSTLDKFINEKNKKFNARLEKQFRRTDT